MLKKYSLLVILWWAAVLYVAAQPSAGLQHKAVLVKGILLPLTPLPDTFKTYKIVVDMRIDSTLVKPDRLSITPGFLLYPLTYSDKSPDLIVRITVSPPQIRDSLISRPVGNITFHRYQAKIIPSFEVNVTDKNGMIYYTKREGVPCIFNTSEFKIPEDARKNFNNLINSPDYWRKLLPTYQRTIDLAAKKYRNAIVYQDENINLYTPEKSAPEFVKHIEEIETALLNLSQTRSVVLAKQAIMPHIIYLEQQFELNTKNKYTQRAAILNLISIYRTTKDYDKAIAWTNELIETGFEHTRTTIDHLLAVKERFETHEYYRKNRYNQLIEKEIPVKLSSDSLKRLYEVSGRVILRNGQIASGTILDIFENFKLLKVKLKYQKKLSTRIGDTEYNLADVAEIHLKNTKLVVVQQQAQFYLCYIQYESQRIGLYRTVPGMGDISFVKKTASTSFVPVTNSLYLVRTYLNDCPLLVKQIFDDYYQSSNMLEIVRAYDEFCGEKPASSTTSIDANLKSASTEPKPQLDKPTQLPSDESKTVKSINRNPESTAGVTDSPKAYVGFSTGMNNFNSVGGLTVAIRLRPKLYTRAGFGAGVWGMRWALGLKYDLRRDSRYRQGYSFAFGYGYHKGGVLSEVSYTVNTNQGPTPTEENRTAIVYTYPVHSAHLSTIYNVPISAKWVAMIEFGYNIGFRRNAWSLQTGIDELDARKAIRLAQPGGLIIGAGIYRMF